MANSRARKSSGSYNDKRVFHLGWVLAPAKDLSKQMVAGAGAAAGERAGEREQQ